MVWALDKGHVEIVRALLDKGATGGERALQAGVEKGNAGARGPGRRQGEADCRRAFGGPGLCRKGGQGRDRRATAQGGSQAVAARRLRMPAEVLAKYVGTYRATGGPEGEARGAGTAPSPASPAARSRSELAAVDGVTFRPEGEATPTVVVQFEGMKVVGLDRAERTAGDSLAPRGGDEVNRCCLLAVLVFALAAPAYAAQPWPSFRGAGASGVADGPAAPKWNAETGEGVLWKATIPGLAVSSPIVWGDRVFVTTAVSSDPNAAFRHGLYGDVEPSKDVTPALVAGAGPRREDRQGALGARAPTRACRGRSVIPSRARPRRLRPPTARSSSCPSAPRGSTPTTSTAQLLWKTRPRRPERRLVLRSRLRVGRRQLADHLERPRDRAVRHPEGLVRRRLRRSRTASRSGAPSATRSRPGATPTVVEVDGKAELVTQATKFIRGYDPLTGKELWRLGPNSEVTTPTPIVAHGLVYRDERLPRHPADLRDQAGRHAATSRSQGQGLERRPSPGARSAAGPTCRRRSSTATTSTRSPTTAS